MQLSIIIVSFNTKELLQQCLGSLGESTFKDFEVIVVDNGSTDGTVELIQNLKIKMQNDNLKLKIIQNKNNLGFAKACNQGIIKAKGKYLLFLNSDTQATPYTLKKMVEFAENHSEAGAIGARLFNPDGTIQPSIYYLPNFRRVIDEIFKNKGSYFEKYFIPSEQAQEVEAVIFAAVLIPRGTIEKAGLLNERYFMYFEDLDYCRRVRNLGLKIYYLSEAEVIHKHGGSGKNNIRVSDYIDESSKIYYGRIRFWLIKILLRGIHRWQKVIGKN